MARHWRMVVACSAFALGIAVVWAGSAIGAPGQTNAVDAKLVGKWTRKVTSTDIKRTGIPASIVPIPAGSVWTLTIKKSGQASIAGPPSLGGFTGTVVPAGPNEVHVKLGHPEPDVYRWAVSGRTLTFTKVSDPVVDRYVVFWGAWKRK